MAANMYRVGDYVFFETSSTTPYQIRRIEELNKTPNGNVEAKVMCFYRRRDISSSLILLADKHQMSITGVLEDDDQSEKSDKSEKTEKTDKEKSEKASTEKDEKEDESKEKEKKKEEIKENGETQENGDKKDESKKDEVEKMETDESSEKTDTEDKKDEDKKDSEKEEKSKDTETKDKEKEKKDSDQADDDDDEIKRPKDDFDEKQRHQLKHRELFLSRQVETLPATHIRGKCTVTLLNETESLLSYLNKEDSFFYSLVYDPQQKTLLADKGEIRVGSKFQAQVSLFPKLKEGEKDTRNLDDLEELVWSPMTSHLSDRSIDQFMVIARSVGTFARALDCTSTVRQPSLHMSAAAASRDVTLFHAMDTLHKHKYDISKAISSLVPPGGPVLCRDEMEEWSASEANLFEEALDKYGKDFNDIRQDFLPWKSLKSIVEYYYMWKTTDRYVQQKRIKAAEAETKLKQVYIPNYNKPNPAQITGKMNGIDGMAGRACESCYTSQSSQWYAWGPVHMQCRLCSHCWTYWKKYGGLKMPTRLGRLMGEDGTMGDDGERPGPNQRQERMVQMTNSFHIHRCTIGGCGKEFKMKAHLARHLANTHGLAIRSGSPRPVMKTRAAFCLITTALTRASRQVCKDILKIHRAARQPFTPINIAAIKQEFSAHYNTESPGADPSTPAGSVRLTDEAAKKLRPLKKKDRILCDGVSDRLGVNIKVDKPALLSRQDSNNKPPARLRFPVGEKSGYGTAAERSAAATLNNTSPMPTIMKKRGYEQTNGIDGPAAKRPAMGVIRQAGNVRPAGGMMRDTVINHLNGGRGMGGRVPVRRGKTISWIDAPDDVYFFATDNTRKLRKQLTSNDFRRAARKPWRKLNVKVPQLGDARPSGGDQQIVILD